MKQPNTLPDKGYRSWRVEVPIYGLRLHLFLCDTHERASRLPVELNPLFGNLECADVFDGRLIYKDDRFGIFLIKGNLRPGLIAHEIFHCACRMMEFIHSDLTRERHEPHAYLVEWITDWVYRCVTK